MEQVRERFGLPVTSYAIDCGATRRYPQPDCGRSLGRRVWACSGCRSG
jgi:hypothetical protein